MLHNPLCHFTHFLSDVSPVFSKAGPDGEFEGACGLATRSGPPQVYFSKLLSNIPEQFP